MTPQEIEKKAGDFWLWVIGSVLTLIAVGLALVLLYAWVAGKVAH